MRKAEDLFNPWADQCGSTDPIKLDTWIINPWADEPGSTGPRWITGQSWLIHWIVNLV